MKIIQKGKRVIFDLGVEMAYEYVSFGYLDTFLFSATLNRDGCISVPIKAAFLSPFVGFNPYNNFKWEFHNPGIEWSY